MRATISNPASASRRLVDGHFSCVRPSTSIRPSLYRSNGTSTQEPPAQDPIIFSGIQPTGVPHLGNYLGALREWVKLQDEAKPGTKLLFSIVDLHALTVPQDAVQLRKWRREAFATLLAVGLDPSRSTIFYQSEVRGCWSICLMGRGS
jgi:tryptophanyl-tRNA synthetase